jgi:hypothetical protein
MKYVILILIAVLLLVAVFFVTCGRVAQDIHFIIPEGFKGVLKIKKDPDGEENVKKEGIWIFSFPPDGTLKVKNIKPIELSRKCTASYQSGGSIGWQRQPELLKPPYNDTEVNIFHCYAEGSGWFVYFVGTAKEWDKWVKEGSHYQ